MRFSQFYFSSHCVKQQGSICRASVELKVTKEIGILVVTEQSGIFLSIREKLKKKKHWEKGRFRKDAGRKGKHEELGHVRKRQMNYGTE